MKEEQIAGSNVAQGLMAMQSLGKKIFPQVWGLRNQITKQNVTNDKIFATS